jgi:glycosyltransferase involved in cell wall biosynthesis
VHEVSPPQRRKIISPLPFENPANAFVGLFSQALTDQGFILRRFNWKWMGLQRTDFVIVHWPEYEFTADCPLGMVKPLVKLSALWLSKLLWGTKFIWLAHNATAHDTQASALPILRSFLNSLDGVVYLSKFSYDRVRESAPRIYNCKSLVTVHGHYREAFATQATARRRLDACTNLAYIGQIRPYKNIAELVAVASSISPGLNLSVAGRVADHSLRAAIEASAHGAPHIHLDLRDDIIADAELEAIVDSADAIVLPYKQILNSGSALLALSRNRPVLAPRMGSFPELQEKVGTEWVYLYDGDFNQQVLVDFMKWMRETKRAEIAPLDAYEWSRVGRDLREFIESLDAGG